MVCPVMVCPVMVCPVMVCPVMVCTGVVIPIPLRRIDTIAHKHHVAIVNRSSTCLPPRPYHLIITIRQRHFLLVSTDNIQRWTIRDRHSRERHILSIAVAIIWLKAHGLEGIYQVFHRQSFAFRCRPAATKGVE